VGQDLLIDPKSSHPGQFRGSFKRRYGVGVLLFAFNMKRNHRHFQRPSQWSSHRASGALPAARPQSPLVLRAQERVASMSGLTDFQHGLLGVPNNSWRPPSPPEDGEDGDTHSVTTSPPQAPFFPCLLAQKIFGEFTGSPHRPLQGPTASVGHRRV
jgi:hypothetical protein